MEAIDFPLEGSELLVRWLRHGGSRQQAFLMRVNPATGEKESLVVLAPEAADRLSEILSIQDYDLHPELQQTDIEDDEQVAQASTEPAVEPYDETCEL